MLRWKDSENLNENMVKQKWYDAEQTLNKDFFFLNLTREVTLIINLNFLFGFMRYLYSNQNEIFPIIPREMFSKACVHKLNPNSASFTVFFKLYLIELNNKKVIIKEGLILLRLPFTSSNIQWNLPIYLHAPTGL